MMNYQIVEGEQSIETQVLENNLIQVFEKSHSYDWMPHTDGSFTVKLNETFYKLYNVQVNGSSVSFQHKGHFYQFTVKDELAILMEQMGFKDSSAAEAGSLKAPMPGKIIQLVVQEGDTVTAGQAVIILEAMKMENELKTTIDGTVKRIAVIKGQSVEKNELLLEIE